MPTSTIYLPLSEKRPLAEHELQKINAELRKLNTHFTWKILMSCSTAVFLAVAFFRNSHHEPFVGQFGLYKGLLTALLLFLAPLFWLYLFKKRKLLKDLKERAKIVRQTNVARKERSFMSKKIYARIDSDEPVFHEFEVDDHWFDRLRQGQHVKLEFTPNSKCLLNIEPPLDL